MSEDHTHFPPEVEQALQAMPGVEMLDGFRWYDQPLRWACPLELLGPPGGAVPRRTRWFLVADQVDGTGEVELHPALDGGLPRTWPHQAWNGSLGARTSWTSGSICPRQSSASRVLLLRSEEPPAFPERAVWLIQAAQRWLDAAADGTLAPPGSDLELPPVPTRAEPVLAFYEGAEQLPLWQAQLGRSGLARVGVVHPDSLVAALSFSLDAQGEPWQIPWGAAMRGIATQREEPAAWITLPRLPLLSPWHVPGTWGELRQVIAEQIPGKSLDDLLFRVREILDRRPRWLLIGAPVPARVGELPARMTWLAARMPALPDPAHPPRGFRGTDASLRLYVRQIVLRDGLDIDWASTENWHPDIHQARGVHPELYPHPTLLIGGGAIGSTLGDLLVRGGTRRVEVYDPDTIAIGNLTRHTAFFSEVGTKKAHTLGVRLALSSPHVSVERHQRRYPPREDAARRAAEACTLVIDATAENRVLRALAQEQRPQDTTFVCLWVGYQARRTYIFTARGRSFPLEAWRAAVEPWLDRERALIDLHGLPREGVGCWSEVFPAHGEDIWWASTLAIQVIVHVLDRGPTGLVVYQQDRDPDGLPRTLRIRDPADISPM